MASVASEIIACVKPGWIVTAESCTGGLVCQELTRVPGASAVLWGGLVTYADNAKRSLTAVDAGLLERHGAVSAEAARAMALGAASRCRESLGGESALPLIYSVATTGFAGPGGGTAEHPVGTCFIAATRSGGGRRDITRSERVCLGAPSSRAAKETDRMALQAAFTAAALRMLLEVVREGD